MYEYVKKSEYAPVKKELERMIRSVQIEMRKKYGLTFRFELIGSGQKHLVTRVRGGNGGYDFDYNLIIRNWGTLQDQAKTLKLSFMAAFKNALRGTPYSAAKDSTSAITIKVVDKKQKKISHRCDFAIIYYDKCGSNNGYYYLRNNKKQNVYEFVFRSLNSGIKEKEDNILEVKNGWEYIRQEYRKLKDVNEGNEKHSYSLYAETINNVYNKMFNQGKL
ncbi:hypothetical protein C823_004784 [Eubacterium plexicaudatum ASF492]|uniref:Uncharacterized protein n=1 Tax=Eubacterium plexicaudatum ASF492 TaxID=1235802 RepID=N1ZW90_9FIRM|nr:hypothetical protein C823_004784 [Eubacterium plexicaudatum ASF492]